MGGWPGVTKTLAVLKSDLPQRLHDGDQGIPNAVTAIELAKGLQVEEPVAAALLQRYAQKIPGSHKGVGLLEEINPKLRHYGSNCADAPSASLPSTEVPKATNSTEVMDLLQQILQNQIEIKERLSA